MEFHSMSEVHDYIWNRLRLSERSVTFYILDVGDGRLYVGSGVAYSSIYLYEDDLWTDVGMMNYDKKIIHVDSCESWKIGDGKTEYADTDDCQFIEDFMYERPYAMYRFLCKYGNCPTYLTDFDIGNPEYEEPDADEDFD